MAILEVPEATVAAVAMVVEVEAGSVEQRTVSTQATSLNGRLAVLHALSL